jgi:hypothetical protein
MQPAVKDITIRRGDTKELFFRVRTKVWNATTSAWEPGPYKDLTGYTVAAQVRTAKDATSILLTFAVTLGNQADLTNGRGAVLLKIPGTDTAAVPLATVTGVYDVQFTEPDGDPFTYLEGNVLFTEDVTRP